MSEKRGWENEEFNGFYQQHAGLLYRIAYQNNIQHEDAKDLVQETLLRALDRLDPDSDPRGAAKWLITTIRRLIADRPRKPANRKTHLSADAVLASLEATADKSFDLNELVAQLPPRERHVIVLLYCENYTQEDIAEELQISQPTVSKLLARAHRRLGELLADT